MFHPASRFGRAEKWMKVFRIQLFGHRLFKAEWGVDDPPFLDSEYSSTSAQTEPRFGFIPASVEFDKPQPLG